jgi:hypothetical protein
MIKYIKSDKGYFYKVFNDGSKRRVAEKEYKVKMYGGEKKQLISTNESMKEFARIIGSLYDKFSKNKTLSNEETAKLFLYYLDKYLRKLNRAGNNGNNGNKTIFTLFDEHRNFFHLIIELVRQNNPNASIDDIINILLGVVSKRLSKRSSNELDEYKVLIQNFIQTAYRTQQLKRGFTEYEIRQQFKKYLLSLPQNNNVHIFRNLSNKELTKILDVLLPKIIKTLTNGNGNGSIPNIIIPIIPIIPITRFNKSGNSNNQKSNNPGNK